MKDFVWHNPTRVIFGRGAADRIGEAARPCGEKALLVYGTSSIKNSGLYDRVLSSLHAAGVRAVDFGGARSNPVLSHVRKGVELARAEEVDFLVAVGGGSVMDTAKAVAVGAVTDRDLWDFFTFKALPERALPVVTLVTIPASGSEMNKNCVLTNDETGEKFVFAADCVCPVASIMDPSVTFTVSKAYTAYSAADIISHVLDTSFTSAADWTPMQDNIAEGIIKALIQSVDRIMEEPEDYDGRATMMWCATWALNGLMQCGLGDTTAPLHMLEHPMSALFDVPHGAGMSIIMPAWLRITSQQSPSRCARLARSVFGVVEDDDARAAEAGIAALRSWFDSIGTPTSFSAVNISPQDVDNLTETAHRQWNNLGLPVPREFFAAVYDASL